MKAIVIPQYGGPDVLTSATRPRRKPAAGEVIVRTQRLHKFRRHYVSRRRLPWNPAPPLIAGREYCGELDALKPV